MKFLSTGLLTVGMLVCCLCVRADEVPGAKPPTAVWIERGLPKKSLDQRTDSERLFAPFGYMPPERVSQIAVNQRKPLDPRDDSRGTCIEYYFEMKKASDWMGVYSLVDGCEWGTKPGINVGKILGVGPSTPLALRFRAKGEGTVTFKIGGVRTGEHKSSLAFALEPKKSPTQLTREFREYTIGPIQARQLTNLIDPFCVVCTGLDNARRESVQVFVTDIRLEPYTRSLPNGWRERLEQTLWISYTPTGFDPTVKPVKRPTAEAIRADLKAIRAVADQAKLPGDRVGVVLYGCRDGLETIAPLAHEAKLSVLLGIFHPRDAVEVANAKKLLEQPDLVPTIAGCCVGNEAITFRRANLREIQQVATVLRNVRPVPMATTEIIDAYGDKKLFEFDFTFPNVHALFSEVREVDRAVRWTSEKLRDLSQAAPKGHLILVKEVGWPSGPEPFSAEQQTAYWKAMLRSPIARKMNVCIFDGLANTPWKNETVTLGGDQKVNIGPRWAVLLDAQRKPKTNAVEVLELWKKTRP